MSPGEIVQPDGATPLDPEEVEGLLAPHLTTHAQLNEWEHQNIARAFDWALRTRTRTVPAILTRSFAEDLHRRMFEHTWSWAGTYRTTVKNIGVPAWQIRTALLDCLQNAATWHSNGVYPHDELAARFHHQLVVIHPWPNGNGRWARLFADSYLHGAGQAPISWGGSDLNTMNPVRDEYIRALRSADAGVFDPLLKFVRQ